MKKTVSILLVLVLALVTMLGCVTVAYADALEDECNLVFENALEEIFAEENITAENITIIKEPVYDLSLVQLGFIYSMHYDNKEGFAFVINTDGNIGVSEFCVDAVSPYEGYNGDKVYVNQMLYLVWQDNRFIDTESGAVLDAEAISKLSEKAFSSGGSFSYGSETINYTSKSEDKFKIAPRYPTYFPVGLSNACVPAAGASVIGFWTRYYPELIPGFTPGYTAFGQYLYLETSDAADPVIETLYDKMNTNKYEDGTNIAQFISGMNSYVSEKGKNISYSSTMTNGNFNYSLAKQKLESGVPLVLFVDKFRIDEFQEGTNQSYISYTIAQTCHAMAGFGYSEITYTLTNGTTRTDTYIQVATGLVRSAKAYYNIYYNTQIDESYAITIS